MMSMRRYLAELRAGGNGCMRNRVGPRCLSNKINAGTPPMAKHPKKQDFPVSEVRRYLEPGPIVLVSSRWEDQRNIMTMGWHTVMEFAPSLIGCVIASGNHSFELIHKSRECVINLPTTALTDTVVRIGNTTGSETDKFREFGVTADEASEVRAPLIRECHANFECRLYDDALIDRYNFFIFEVVRAHVAASPKHPETLHYKGGGVFMIAGKTISRRSLFQPGML
jgi:flavin reductase (DIM6/NTAB) family NADH-FMN oxidoreductase RutF